MDKYFRVEVISKTPNPQQTIYAAMHQDYAEGFVFDERDKFPNEERCGQIIVDRLLAGNRGHYGCYSADTEVMTKEGWIKWSNVTSDMELLAVNPIHGTAEFEKPSALQNYDFDPHDRMYSVQSQYLDLLVTADHRMVVSNRKKDNSWNTWRFSEAKQVYRKPVRYLLNCCLTENQRAVPELPVGVDPLTAMKLAGFFFGDGMRSRSKEPGVLRFRLRRPRKIAYLLGLGLKVNPKAGDRYTVENKNLAVWINRFFSSGAGKVVPKWLIILPHDLVAAFWDGLKNSDGTKITSKSWSYDSCEKEALDTIQATAHINGFSANLYLNNPNEGKLHRNHRPCWRLTISEHSTRRVETGQKGRSPGVTEAWVEYSGRVYCASVSTGALLVRRNGKAVVCGNCIEHPQITLNCGYFPHSVLQQVRTHRVGITFHCDCIRYTGKRVCNAATYIHENWSSDKEGCLELVEKVMYLRPVGHYTDRSGANYEYTEELRHQDLLWCVDAVCAYQDRISKGYSEEHARGILPFDYRQHWVVSVNVRSLMHLLDLRWKADAQLECQWLCDLIFPQFQAWVPTIAKWYMKNRAHKARLAP